MKWFEQESRSFVRSFCFCLMSSDAKSILGTIQESQPSAPGCIHYEWRNNDVNSTCTWLCWRVFVLARCCSPSVKPRSQYLRKCRSVASFCRLHPPPRYPCACPPVSATQAQLLQNSHQFHTPVSATQTRLLQNSHQFDKTSTAVSAIPPAPAPVRW